MNPEPIALFDMDGTLCDYEKGLARSLKKLKSPHESPIKPPFRDVPKYLMERMNLIRQSEEWWSKLPKLKLGFDIWKLAGQCGFRRMILTQGPKYNPRSWSGKKIWIDKNLGKRVDITITRDKGLVYGKVLVDDYPEYIERWLKWRPRGFVIMPAAVGNESFRHKQVIRYDGNVDVYAQICVRMMSLKEKNS